MALPNWMQRLWRGEVPLWKAFWLYYLLGTTVVNVIAIYGAVLIGAAIEKLGYSGEPADAAFGLTAIVLGPIALSYIVLADVGTIRSGSKQGGFLGVLALIVVVLSLIPAVIKYAAIILMGIALVGQFMASLLA